MWLIFALTIGMLLIIAAYQDWMTLHVETVLLYSMLICSGGFSVMTRQWLVVIFAIGIFFILGALQRMLQTFGEADIYAWVAVFGLMADLRFLLWLGVAVICTCLLFSKAILRKQPVPFFPGMAFAYFIILGGMMIWW